MLGSGNHGREKLGAGAGAGGFDELIASWREKADDLRMHQATQIAATYEICADALESTMRRAEDERLTLREGARESGYSARRLRELIAEGKLPNAGMKGAPRIRRADLPRRVRAQGGFDAHAEVQRLLSASQ